MSAFRSSALGHGAAVGLCVGLLLVAVPRAGARAQEAEVGEPLQLAPPVIVVPGEAEEEGGEAAPGSGEGAALPGGTAEGAEGPEGIEIAPLSEIDPEAIGTLDPEGGGFDTDLWRGTARRTVERLLPRLPGAIRSAAMRDLARRLLLSSVAPPSIQPGEQAGPRRNLLAMRVGRLAAMGEFEGLRGLLEAAPQRHDQEALARARVETLLLDGQGESACSEVRLRVSEHGDSRYWRKALVFCQILQGDQDAANLGLALLREGDSASDPVFFALAEEMLGLGAAPAEVKPSSALHLAMLQTLRRPLPVEAVERAGPGLLVLLARAEGNSLSDRVAAAEQAVRLGLLSVEELGALYRAMPFTPEQRASAISSAQTLEGAERRALLFQAAEAQSVPSARAEILNAAFRAARQEGRILLTARVFEPLIADIPLQPELAWFAADAGRALYATGRFEQAHAWLNLAREQSFISAQAATATRTLWPYNRLAAGSSPGWDGNLVAWAEAQSSRAPETVAAQQLLLRVIFHALGESDSLAWSELVGAGASAAGGAPASGEGAQVDVAVLYALSEASQFGRLGETVLLALLALGEASPADVNPMVLHEVLTALARVGLMEEARKLAIEAAVASGV